MLRRTVRRDQLVKVVAGLSPCLIGMEACSGAHEWGRRFQEHGHAVRLMAEHPDALILSGLLDHEADEVVAAFAPLRERRRLTSKGWSALLLSTP